MTMEEDVKKKDRPSELTKQQLKERSAEMKLEKEKLVKEALEHFEKHKMEIALWNCKFDNHVTYLS